MRTIKEISAQKKKHQEDFSENAKISGKIIFKNDPSKKIRGGIYRKIQYYLFKIQTRFSNFFIFYH